MERKANKSSSSEMRTAILKRRYLWKNKEGNVVETEEQMYRRVSNAMAAVESQYGATDEQVKATADEFYQQMAEGRFLPNSPTLMNAGRKNGMLSACFVLPIEDSIDGIFTTVKNTAMIQKAGGGTGFSFDKLRPTGDLVASSGGKTSGPISFWRVIAEATNAIQQGAFRRGANMGMMNINHPDIIKFICAKQNLSAFTNFNISVKVPDVFMKLLDDDPNALHIVINPRTGKRYAIPHSVNIDTYDIDDLQSENQASDDCYTVKEIWEIIIKNAHSTGEPGVFFIDHANSTNPLPDQRIECTNPCGEIPGYYPYDVCNLGSINMSALVNKARTDIKWNEFADTIKVAVQFLDNVIDASYYVVPEIEHAAKSNRRIGLGIMGFWDCLVAMGISYNSQDAILFAEKLAKFLAENTYKASSALAEEKGCFPNWAKSTWKTVHKKPMRNIQCLSIAPTGSISIIANCCASIEPLFSLATQRITLDGKRFVEIHPFIKNFGVEEGWWSHKIEKQIKEGISPCKIPEIPEKYSRAMVTANQVTPEQHIRMVAAFQKYIDNGVSKTVNLAASASTKDVDETYRLAWQLGCKGITVYRDGCRENQVITTAGKASEPDINTPSPRPRPRKTTGTTIKSKTGCGSLFITLNKDEEGLFEIFTNLGKAGGCPSQSEATARIVSVALRSGVEPEVLIEQLKGIRCLSTVTRRKSNKDIDVLSCPDAIARAMQDALGQGTEMVTTSSINKCPDCSFPLRKESGCNVCDNCGYSKCG